MKNLLIKIYLSVVLSLLISGQIFATNYYVSTSGNNNNSGTSQNSAWRTIQKAANTMQAGDKVYIQSGTYSEDVSISRSGNANAGYISFIGQGDVVMDGQNSLNIAFRNNDASYIHIENIVIQNYTEEGIRFAPYNGPRIHHFRFKDLSISNTGIYKTWSGNHGLQIQETDYFLVDNVFVYNSRGNNIMVYKCQNGAIINSEASGTGQREQDDEDGIAIQNSQYIRTANCTANGNPEDGIDIGGEGANGDIAHISVYGCTTMNNLKKGLSYSVTSNGEFAAYNITFARCLSTGNAVSAMSCYQGANDFRIVHNTYADNGSYGLNMNAPVSNGIIKNCIFAFQGENFSKNLDESTDVIDIDYISWYPNLPYESFFRGNNHLEQDPQFGDRNNDDYTLNNDSPCIDWGENLTSTTSGGSGTQISVGDAKYFSDGYYEAPGDMINVGSETVQVIDIQGNTITVDRSISWGNDTPVNFEFEGNAPDLGYIESEGTTPPPPTADLWIPTLPQSVQDGILWKAEHEDNDLCEWTSCGYQYAGGGIFNDEPDEVTSEASNTIAHSGNYSAYTQITNTCQAQNPKHAVRLMRWTDAAWDNGGSLFPTETYYSTWMYLPHVYNSNKYEPWDPGDGGWWNVFQFKSKASDGASDPVFTFNITHDDENNEMYFFMYTKENSPSQYNQSGDYKPIPAGQWVHIEALYKASDPYTPNGEVKFWQDGELILEANNVITQLSERIVFGIGNYTDHIDGPEGCGTATIYFDDVIVGTEAVNPHVGGTNPPPPPPPTTECDLIDNGDFSDNLDNWSDWGCEMELQNGEVLVDISSNSAGIKKGNSTLTFTEGKTYRITFDARAQSGRNMKVKANLDYPPYDLYFQEEVALTTTMQSYELSFTMNQYSAASALEFNFGGHMSNVYLDNVQVSEVDCGETPPPPPSPEGDLSIRYIQRLPEIEYVQNSTNPAVEGWPAVGQQVTWRAKVKHWGTSTATFDYRWYLDGAEVASGTKSVDEGQEVDIDYTQNWNFDRRELKLVIDTGNDFAEDEEDNNEVSIFTDALSAGFYIEQGLYDYFHQYQNQLGVGSNSYEDWAHRQVEIWNDMLAEAVTADTPNGVLDRIRLDKITVVADGDLPLAGGSPGYPTNLPAIDKTIDLIWGFPTEHYQTLGTFSNKTLADLSNPFYFDRGLFHELGHARYLIDVYGFNIEYEGGQTIDIQENGVDIDDAGLFPSPYRTDMSGLMNQSGEYAQVDAYSAMAFNLIAGHRAVCGNNNPPCNLGSQPNGFMQDLPAQNRILITDIDGQPLTNADVQIYQSEQGSTEWYGKRFDNTPDLSFTTDQNGYIYVGNNPFSNGVIKHTFGHSNAVVIIRIEKDNNVAYKAFESWRLNMEYWRGNTQLGTYTLESGLEGGTPPPPPPAECDLIDNGDFSSDLNNWADWGCEMELQNGEVFVDINTNSAGIKKGNGTLTFEQGKTYRINFDARAQSGRNMKVKATLDYSPYTLYFQEEVALTTSMQSFEMTFTMGQYSPDSALEFNFKGSTTNVILDNVQVSEVDCGTTPPPPAECDLIDNGDFSDNLQDWADWGCEMELQNGEVFVDINTNSAGIKKGNGTLTFEQGKTYRINFDARAQSGRNMKVKATLNDSPYTLYFQEEVALTTSIQSFELTFTMSQYSENSALEFNFYGNTTNVYLDNVQVTELDCTSRTDIDEITSFQATAFPNPFTGQTQLEYELFQDANVQINVYNTMGQLVNMPVSAQTQFAGTHRIHFGENMPSGVYLCELKVDGSRKIIKIIKGK